VKRKYYLVVDLEATCDDKGQVPREETEIIEIGAVLVEGGSLATVAELMTFVRPIVHPELTAFCTQLTTITQDMVAPAPAFPEAAARLAAFGAARCSARGGTTIATSWPATPPATALRRRWVPSTGTSRKRLPTATARGAAASAPMPRSPGSV